jgi:hypothetical protein
MLRQVFWLPFLVVGTGSLAGIRNRDFLCEDGVRLGVARMGVLCDLL